MPMWVWPWGGVWGYAWICPLLGLLAMVAIAFFCLRRAGGMSGCGCGPRHGPSAAPEVEELRREVERLREENRRLHGSGRGGA
jgi:hypothetical protein